MEEICTRASLAFECAPDLATANGLILRETYDLVFLDVRLPDGDGHQFLERLMTLPDRPIVVLHVSLHGAVANSAALTADDLAPLLALQPEVILLGTGERQVFPPAAVMAACLRQGVGLEVMTNAAAARTFNVLAGESRRVVAGFLLAPG